jgi:hypothetical protein
LSLLALLSSQAVAIHQPKSFANESLALCHWIAVNKDIIKNLFNHYAIHKNGQRCSISEPIQAESFYDSM